MKTLKAAYFLLVAFLSNSTKCQVANMVQNGGFEEYEYKLLDYLPKYWGSIENCYYGIFLGTEITPSKVPFNSFTYQWPRSGKNYLIFENLTGTRGYPMNQLKSKLKGGATYCVKMHFNLSNQSTYGISNMGCHFGDETIDTITACNSPLTYLMPHVLNGANKFLTDTMNWVEVNGQYTASGNEKYLIIGNFFTLNNSNTKLSNPTNLPMVFADYLIDDISVIDVALPAFAGPDRQIVVGDSVFLGRQPDVGIDDACTWYKLPNDSIPIDTIAGFWVKPVSTCTYMVRQVICGNVKLDTVILYENPVGIAKWNILNESTRIYPNPAKDHLFVEISQALSNFELSCTIYNSLGSLICEKEIRVDGKTCWDVSQLDPGVYTLVLRVSDGYSVTKKFVIAR